MNVPVLPPHGQTPLFPPGEDQTTYRRKTRNLAVAEPRMRSAQGGVAKVS
jgi:hypothetical protein